MCKLRLQLTIYLIVRVRRSRFPLFLKFPQFLGGSSGSQKHNYTELRIGTCLMSMRAFVTVGSTNFPELVRAVLSSATIILLAELGFDELCVQYGTDKQLFVEETRQPSATISITGFDYSPSIEREMENADLIISHAGSIRCLAHIDV
jgi:UDP-N-acetylglucosamine:LPS N-acetylglucosamine transferase